MIDRDEMKKLRQHNLREGPVAKTLERLGPAKLDKKEK